MEPSGSAASAATVSGVPTVYELPVAGLVMDTVGGADAPTVTAITAESVMLPRLSVARAVRVYEPIAPGVQSAE